MAKINKNNMVNKNVYSIVADDEFNYNTWIEKPISKAYIEDLGRRLVYWAKNTKNAYTLTQFYSEEGIHRRTFERWADKFPALKGAKEFATQVIADRRHIGGLERKLDPNLVKFTQIVYDPEWQIAGEKWARVTGEQAGVGGIRVVEIEKYPSSDLVPDKKTIKEKE